MHEFIVYRATLTSLGLAGVLLVLQLIVAHLAAIRGKHKSGYPIAADSGSFIFRSARAHLNTIESISAFALIAIAGILLGANPSALNVLAPLWLLSRLSHMVCYYVNAAEMRSLSYVVSLVIILIMAATSLLG
jgi:uncharacterized MAPEG superfamily protein